MRISSLAKIVIGVEDVVVEGASFDETRQALVIDARPRAPQACVCGRCGRRAPYHDAGRGTRLWRCCDVGGARAYVRCEAFRVRCPECGATVRRVPWADHGSRFTRAFEDVNVNLHFTVRAKLPPPNAPTETRRSRQSRPPLSAPPLSSGSRSLAL